MVIAPTAVYRLFDAEGALIYVGITDSPGARWRNHSVRDWWPRVASYTLTWHDHRADAEAEEAHAITHELPAENLMVPVTALEPDYTDEQWAAAPRTPRRLSTGTRRPNGGGSLFQRRSDGLWIGIAQCGYAPGTGMPVRKQFSSKDRATAEAKLDAYMADIAAHRAEARAQGRVF